jgi:NAD(P)-dependent dehydrogenase (short-subunit alcohol dehydrogenase family)
MMKLKGKTIVVTGGGRGLGRAMSLAFARKGARLAIVGIDETVTREAVERCEEAGTEARAYRANVSDESAVIDLFDRVIEDFGSLGWSDQQCGNHARWTAGQGEGRQDHQENVACGLASGYQCRPDGRFSVRA